MLLRRFQKKTLSLRNSRRTLRIQHIWRQFPYLTGSEDVSVPALFIESWYDYGPQDTFEQFNHFRARSGALKDSHRVVMDPGIHCGQHTLTDKTVIGERPLGDARFDFFRLYLAWFDYWLRGEETGADRLPLVTYFRMGDNRWRSAQAWPPQGVVMTPFYFDRKQTDQNAFGVLTKDQPQSSGFDVYVYDPANPSPTLGAPVCCTTAADGQSLEGAFDQSPNARRKDVLIYETEPLKHAMDVTGPVTVTLFVSSDAPDTDFTAKLIDVYPDGRAFNVVDGIQRMRWRSGYDKPRLLEQGGVYEVSLDLQATSNLFMPGRRIRVEISSSNFPRFSRNLNTGQDNHSTSDYRVANNKVHRGGMRASHIMLPVLPSKQADTKP